MCTGNLTTRTEWHKPSPHGNAETQQKRASSSPEMSLTAATTDRVEDDLTEVSDGIRTRDRRDHNPIMA
jgi:hypothetical protein